ncbi:MAG: cache domain-containing protein, partial [Bacillota bacterium]|nr:cache domain-containing protein [Bacillota bacterium]
MYLQSIKSKIILLGVIPIIFFILASFAYILPSIEADIYGEKETKTKELVDVGLSILDYYYWQEQQGILSREEAQAKAKEAIRNVRFGDLLLDYYWINDFQPAVIMHPFRPDLEGQDVSDIQDSEGIYLFREFVKVATEHKSGFVPYTWQYYEEFQRIEPKLSYVAAFEPWNWIIGTGIYINDINAIVASKRNVSLAFILSAAAIALIALILLINRVVLNPIRNLADYAAQLGDGNFSEQHQVLVNDEIGYLGKMLNKMAVNIEGLVERISKQKKHLEVLFDKSPDAILLIDNNQQIVAANARFQD